MKSISSIVLGVILIVVTLILMPLILDANDSILTDATVDNFTGLEAIAGVGPLIILLALFASGGLFTFSGIKGKGTGTKSDIAKIIGSVVAMVVALILFTIVMTQTAALLVSVAAAEGNVTALVSVVRIIPMILYVGIVMGSGLVQVKAHQRVRASRHYQR